MQQWRRYPDYPRMHQLIVDGEPLDVFVEQGQVTTVPTSNVRDAIEGQLRSFQPGDATNRSQGAFVAMHVYPSLQIHLDKLGTIASEPPTGIPDNLAAKMSATTNVGSAALLGDPYEASILVAKGPQPFPSVDTLRSTQFDYAKLFVSERGLEIVASKAPEKQRASKFFRRIDKLSNALDPFTILDIATNKLASRLSKEQRSVDAYNAINQAASLSNKTITFFAPWQYQRDFRLLRGVDGTCMLLMFAMVNPGNGCDPFGVMTTIAFTPRMPASEVAATVGDRLLASRRQAEPDLDITEFEATLRQCRDAIDKSPPNTFTIVAPGNPKMVRPYNGT